MYVLGTPREDISDALFIMGEIDLLSQYIYV